MVCPKGPRQHHAGFMAAGAVRGVCLRARGESLRKGHVPEATRRGWPRPWLTLLTLGAQKAYGDDLIVDLAARSVHHDFVTLLLAEHGAGHGRLH